MKEKGYSKNKLCVETGLRFETIQGYYNGTISRIDLHILSSLCETLHWNVQDIIEYKKKQPFCELRLGYFFKSRGTFGFYFSKNESGDRLYR